MKWTWVDEQFLYNLPVSLPGAYAETLAEALEAWLNYETQRRVNEAYDHMNEFYDGNYFFPVNL